jgi:phage terminase large subunit GpA-like protein
MPIVRTIPEAHKLMTMDAPDGSGRKRGEGNVRRRRIGEALFLFGWTSGKATTESFPMDVLTFDEVQEMSLAQMEKARERLSASSFRYNLMGSTANWPDSDIHFWYKEGTQHRFHTECPTCGACRPLDDYFPACIAWDPEQVDTLTKRPGAYRYVCEAGHWIDDPQRGEWRPGNPDAWIVSAHFPQMLSPTISPGEIMDKFNNATDRKNFYNRVLGKPWLDPSQIPVTLEHMARCVEEGKKAGLVWKTRARGAFMGIDQMGQHNVVVIKERLPDGRQAVIHLEEIYSDDPFARCS